MIFHLAFFTWAEGVTEEQIAGLTADLEAMAEQIPAIVQYACGTNLRLRPSDVDYVVVAAVTDQAGLASYLDHAAHRAVQSTWLDRMVGERRAAQLPMPFAVDAAGVP